MDLIYFFYNAMAAKAKCLIQDRQDMGMKHQRVIQYKKVTHSYNAYENTDGILNKKISYKKKHNFKNLHWAVKVFQRKL